MVSAHVSGHLLKSVLTRSHIEYISVRGSSKAPGLASEVEGLLDRDRPATDVDVPEVALVVP